MRYIILLMVLFVLLACEGMQPVPRQAVIIDKRFEPEETTLQYLPLTTYVGAGKIRTPVTHMLPYYITDHADYILYVDVLHPEGVTVRKRIYTTPAYYDSAAVGDTVASGEPIRFVDTNNTKERAPNE